MQEPPASDEYRTLQLYVPHALPDGWQALVAALAYRHGAALAHAADSSVLGSASRKVLITLHTGGKPWPNALVDRFSVDLDEALRHALGMQWLDARGVLQFIETERVVHALGDDFSERMLSAVRQNQPSGWRKPLEAIIERAPKVAGDKATELAVVAAAKGLLGWAAPFLSSG